MRKKLKTILYSFIFMGTILVSIPVYANQQDIEIVTDAEGEIQPRTDIKEWLFKVENGNLYKRLYNYTRNRWETDWIFVMSGVEEL